MKNRRWIDCKSQNCLINSSLQNFPCRLIACTSYISYMRQNFSTEKDIWTQILAPKKEPRLVTSTPICNWYLLGNEIKLSPMECHWCISHIPCQPSYSGVYCQHKTDPSGVSRSVYHFILVLFHFLFVLLFFFTERGIKSTVYNLKGFAAWCNYDQNILHANILNKKYKKKFKEYRTVPGKRWSI